MYSEETWELAAEIFKDRPTMGEWKKECTVIAKETTATQVRDQS